MTLVNARGGGEWGSFRFWESFKSVKCNVTSKDIYRNQIDKSKVFEFSISKKHLKLLVTKASILINGVSLTISKIKKNSFEIWTIPHTLKLTNLSNINQNDLVNVEIDILSKYTKKFINEKK